MANIDLTFQIPGNDIYGVPNEFKTKDAYIAFFKYGVHRSTIQPLRGTGSYAPILSKKNSIEGSSFTNYFERFVPLSLNFQSAGGTDLRENAEEMLTVNDTVHAGYYGKAVKKTETVKSQIIQRYGSMQNYMAQLRFGMADWWRRVVDMMVVCAMFGRSTPDFKPMYDAQKAGEMPFACRTLVGTKYKEYHYDETWTLNQVIHNIIGNDQVAAGQMSVEHIRMLRRMATTPLYNSPRIEPVALSAQGLSNIETYYLFMDDAAAAQLVKDEDYKALFYGKPFYEQGLPSALTNADYLGRIVDIECYKLPLFDILKNLGIEKHSIFNRCNLHDNISWSVLVGAGAAGEIIGAYKELTAGNAESQEWADRYNYGLKFLYGVHALNYPFRTSEKVAQKQVLKNINISTKNRRIEQGIIHSFTVNEGGANWHQKGSFQIEPGA